MIKLIKDSMLVLAAGGLLWVYFHLEKSIYLKDKIHQQHGDLKASKKTSGNFEHL